MTNKVWTIEEMNEINALRKAGNSWQYIADKMYYTYEEGYLVSAHELDAQHKLWLEQEKEFEKANKLYDAKSEIRKSNPPRRKMGRLSILEKTEIIQYTEIHKMSIEDIAKKMNRNTTAIKNYLEKYNVSKRNNQPEENIIEDDNSDDSAMSSADLIKNQCDLISQMLVAKNEQYGDSVFKPMRIFSKVDATQQLRVRIDDKISRLIRGNDSIESDEDIIDDLIGYLILLKIQMRNTHSQD